MELVWGSRGGEQDRAALAEFQVDGLELALLMGEFGALLLTDYISVVPAEHTDCDAGHVLGDLVALTSRYLRRRCHTGGGAQAAYMAAALLIECVQEVDQVSRRRPRCRRPHLSAHRCDVSRTRKPAVLRVRPIPHGVR
ncbi:hypothetical protein ACF1HJ_41575 [Streptomyces sp. NPDC013978]|uniref:hypothetical protein n=1 Tax=Streptomyces sp. NPDC013978 TaxID=3364869 RepID=UPI0036FA0982